MVIVQDAVEPKLNVAVAQPFLIIRSVGGVGIMKKLFCWLFGHKYNSPRFIARDSRECVAKTCSRCGHRWWI